MTTQIPSAFLYPCPVVLLAAFSSALYRHSNCAIALTSFGDRPSSRFAMSLPFCIWISHPLRIRAWASAMDVRFAFWEAIRCSIVAWYDSFARNRAISHSSYFSPFASGITESEALKGIMNGCTRRKGKIIDVIVWREPLIKSVLGLTRGNGAGNNVFKNGVCISSKVKWSTRCMFSR